MSRDEDGMRTGLRPPLYNTAVNPDEEAQLKDATIKMVSD